MRRYKCLDLQVLSHYFQYQFHSSEEELSTGSNKRKPACKDSENEPSVVADLAFCNINNEFGSLKAQNDSRCALAAQSVKLPLCDIVLLMILLKLILQTNDIITLQLEKIFLLKSNMPNQILVI